jgi:hypothetical protein
VSDDVHALHKMIHTLREHLILTDFDSSHIATRSEADAIAGAEPECSVCHGFGPDSGQAPHELTILPHNLLDTLDWERLDEALSAAGFRRTMPAYGTNVVIDARTGSMHINTDHPLEEGRHLVIARIKGGRLNATVGDELGDDDDEE